MDVWIRESRVRSLLTSAIEVYNRETDGVFSGKNVLRKIRGKKRLVLYVENAYPLQTSERKPSEVYHGNIAAFKRVMHSLIATDIEFMGGYHSHPFPYKGVKLSEADVDFVKDELDFIKRNKHFRTQPNWLEILICIKRIRYQRRHKTGWKSRRRGMRMEFQLTITPYTRYEIIMAAFWIDYSEKKPLVKETGVRVPHD